MIEFDKIKLAIPASCYKLDFKNLHVLCVYKNAIKYVVGNYTGILLIQKNTENNKLTIEFSSKVLYTKTSAPLLSINTINDLPSKLHTMIGITLNDDYLNYVYLYCIDVTIDIKVRKIDLTITDIITSLLAFPLDDKFQINHFGQEKSYKTGVVFKVKKKEVERIIFYDKYEELKKKSKKLLNMYGEHWADEHFKDILRVEMSLKSFNMFRKYFGTIKLIEILECNRQPLHDLLKTMIKPINNYSLDEEGFEIAEIVSSKKMTPAMMSKRIGMLQIAIFFDNNTNKISSWIKNTHKGNNYRLIKDYRNIIYTINEGNNNNNIKKFPEKLLKMVLFK